jgi:hypothetical protein
MTWRDLVGSLISENMLSINAFAKKCYLHHTTVLNLMSDKTSSVQLRTKTNIEKAFGILIDDTDPNNLIVTQTDFQQKRISNMVNEIIEKYSPVRGNYVLGTVTAGRGNVLDYENKEIEEIDYPVDSCFWYVIDKHNGDSMYPFLVENDRVLVDRAFPTKMIKETDLVLVQYAGKGAIKFFSRSEDDANILVFYSSNGSVAPLILRKEKCEYFKVVLIKKL